MHPKVWAVNFEWRPCSDFPMLRRLINFIIIIIIIIIIIMQNQHPPERMILVCISSLQQLHVKVGRIIRDFLS